MFTFVLTLTKILYGLFIFKQNKNLHFPQLTTLALWWI
nr:MAG TPA: hypothetical protein [Caudoviricetes sp.]